MRRGAMEDQTSRIIYFGFEILSLLRLRQRKRASTTKQVLLTWRHTEKKPLVGWSFVGSHSWEPDSG
ncbi:hypothetical protein V6Z11_A10G216500 [Gossypium hirsutum]